MNDIIVFESLKAPANAFGLESERTIRLKAGSINTTYLSWKNEKKYILQCMNGYVFSNPKLVMKNILLLSEYYRKEIKTGEFLNVVFTEDGFPYFENNEGLWRCYNYVDNSFTADNNPSPTILNEVGYGIAQFHNMFNDFPALSLSNTIANFHNALMRFEQFAAEHSQFKCNRQEYIELAKYILGKKTDIYQIWDAVQSSKLPLRVTHNDTSLANILIDMTTNKFRCLIDLDTVMAGTLIYDFGDCARDIIQKYYDSSSADILCALDSFCHGFADGSKRIISTNEINNLYNAIWLITLELGIRFIYDFTQNNAYFSAEYETQNLDRAKIQFWILDFLTCNKTHISEMIRSRFV